LPKAQYVAGSQLQRTAHIPGCETPLAVLGFVESALSIGLTVLPTLLAYAGAAHLFARPVMKFMGNMPFLWLPI
jgi:hypothetical protein